MVTAALAAGLGALALAPSAAPSHVKVDAASVRVTLTDSKLIVAPSRVPVGIVVFRIVNRGHGARRFSVGSTRTRAIAPGGSASLRIAFTTPGTRSTASAGVRRATQLTGVIGVFAPCAHPTATTVLVQLGQDNGGLTISQTTIPCGAVTFVVTDTGSLIDSLQVFADYAGAHGTTPELEPGRTASLTIQFTELGNGYAQSGDFPPAEPEFGGDYGEGVTLRIV
jgi:hypothetical protein